jgi:hypothetical protein
LFLDRCLANEGGITQRDVLDDGEAQDQLGWDEVDSAFGYKRDCLAVDMIMVALCDGMLCPPYG